MKTNVLKLSMLLITAGQFTPAHAMSSRLSQAALYTSSRFTPTMKPIERPLQSHLHYNPTLLARTLATQRAEESSRNSYSEQDNTHENNSSQSNWHNDNQSWWQRWRPYFTRSETAPALGFSLFGYHLWWSSEDICQTPEELQDLEKFKKTIEYFRTTTDETKKDNIRTLFKNHFFSGFCPPQISTQTTQHFKTLTDSDFRWLSSFTKNQEEIDAFTNITKTVISIEQQEQELGNYTFIHGYDWSTRFWQDLHNRLYSISHTTPKLPLSLRFNLSPNPKKSSQYSKTRKELTKFGVTCIYDDNIHEIQKHVIFMNFALFSSYGESLRYIFKNYSESSRRGKFLSHKAFAHLGLEKYYKKYENEIWELHSLHAKASNFGAGMIFSFTPEMLRKSVYVSQPYGYKNIIEIEGIGKTDDVKLIIDTLRTTPEKIKYANHLEFVFVITKDCALNPDVQNAEGFKVIPFNAADPEKLALYEQKRDELIAKIKAEIDAERASWSETQKSEHAKTLQQMQDWYATYNCLEDCKRSRLQAHEFDWLTLPEYTIK